MVLQAQEAATARTRTAVSSLTLGLVVAVSTASPLSAAGTGRGAPTPTLTTVDDDGRQCPQAAFTSLQAAVDAAERGATVTVCPGTYDEAVVIDTPLDLRGPGGLPLGPACSAQTPVDERRSAVLTAGLTVLADSVHVSGLAFEGAGTAISTSADHSGYRTTANVIENSALDGIELQSSGRRPTRVDHNCLRSNARAGLASELGALHRARIDHNDTHADVEAISVAGDHPHSRVQIERNTLREDQIGIAVQRLDTSGVTGNDVQLVTAAGPPGDGIAVGGGNTDLLIRANTISRAAGSGILFDREPFDAVVDATNSRIVVRDNVVIDSNRFGIAALKPVAAPAVPGQPAGALKPGNLTSSTLRGNVVVRSGFPGIALQTGNDGNLLRGNRADDAPGSLGISLNGAVGTTLIDNSAHGNGFVDVRDLRREENTWIRTDCDTDAPAGTICGH